MSVRNHSLILKVVFSCNVTMGSTNRFQARRTRDHHVLAKLRFQREVWTKVGRQLTCLFGFFPSWISSNHGRRAGRP
jgi:hypothetical protein